MELDFRKQIVELLKAKFLPLDYGVWQADELLEQVFAVVLNPDHIVGNEFDDET
jgi:hypothetical protein